MRRYDTRLATLEKAIAPKDAFHVLMVSEDETNQEAFARYAKARGCTRAEIGAVVYITRHDAAIL